MVNLYKEKRDTKQLTKFEKRLALLKSNGSKNNWKNNIKSSLCYYFINYHINKSFQLKKDYVILLLKNYKIDNLLYYLIFYLNWEI